LLHISFDRLICSTVVDLASNKYRKGCTRLNTNHPTSCYTRCDPYGVT